MANDRSTGLPEVKLIMAQIVNYWFVTDIDRRGGGRLLRRRSSRWSSVCAGPVQRVFGKRRQATQRPLSVPKIRAGGGV